MHVAISLRVSSVKCQTITFVRYSKQPFIVKQMLNNLQLHISFSSKTWIYFRDYVKKGGVYKGNTNTHKSKDAFKISQHHNSLIEYHDFDLRFSNHVLLLTGIKVQQYN